jgi:hypothetical protein
LRFLLKVTSLATTTDWGVPLRNLAAELKFPLFLLITFGRLAGALFRRPRVPRQRAGDVAASIVLR